MRPFEGCWQRIERAKAHSKTLGEQWNSFIENDPYGVAVEMQDDGTGRLLVWPTVPIPSEFALELGEMLYQFWAALDGCVYAAAILQTGKNPPPNERQLAFPLCASESDFKNAARNIAPLPKQLKLIVDSVQPYRTPKLAAELRQLSGQVYHRRKWCSFSATRRSSSAQPLGGGRCVFDGVDLREGFMRRKYAADAACLRDPGNQTLFGLSQAQSHAAWEVTRASWTNSWAGPVNKRALFQRAAENFEAGIVLLTNQHCFREHRRRFGLNALMNPPQVASMGR